MWRRGNAPAVWGLRRCDLKLSDPMCDVWPSGAQRPLVRTAQDLVWQPLHGVLSLTWRVRASRKRLEGLAR